MIIGYAVTGPEGLPPVKRRWWNRSRNPLLNSTQEYRSDIKLTARSLGFAAAEAVYDRLGTPNSAANGKKFDKVPGSFRIFEIAAEDKDAQALNQDKPVHYKTKKFVVRREVPRLELFTAALELFTDENSPKRRSDIVAHPFFPGKFLLEFSQHAKSRYLIEGLKRNPNSPRRLAIGDEVVLGEAFFDKLHKFKDLEEVKKIIGLFTVNEKITLQVLHPRREGNDFMATVMGGNGMILRVPIADIERAEWLNDKESYDMSQLLLAAQKRLPYLDKEKTKESPDKTFDLFPTIPADPEIPAAPVALLPDKRKENFMIAPLQRNGTPKETLESVLAEFNKQIIGRAEIKKQLHNFVNYLKVQRERMMRGELQTTLTLHTALLGPPGTGKTTIARWIVKILHVMGFLPKDNLVEAKRGDLVGKFIGWTESQTNKKVDQALGGGLLVDEAYSLKGEGNDFGPLAIATLVDRMENDRHRVVVFFAGYREPTMEMIESNDGLKSRIKYYFYLDHNTPDELVAIFGKFAKESGYGLAGEAGEKLKALFEALYEARDETFDNGRLARNVFEKAIENQANRLASAYPNLRLAPKTELNKILMEDIPSKEEVSKLKSKEDKGPFGFASFTKK